MLPINWASPEGRWLTVLGTGLVVGFVAWLGFRLLDGILGRAAHLSQSLSSLRAVIHRPARVLIPLLAFDVALYGAPEDLIGIQLTRQVMVVGVVFCITWLLIRVVHAAGDTIIARQLRDPSDALYTRRLQTQTRVLTQTMVSLLTLIGLAMALMSFPSVRHIGTSLLASAGLAGIVAGLAARPLLGNLIAGVQIGLTQPIRIDDVVIANGEWGTIEEITGTYVVVKIWDQRRMIVPLEWWTQNPFQNWTRTSSALLGTIFLWVDYRMPLEPLRAELKRLCEGSLDWDKQVCVLQVTDADKWTMQLRCLVSAMDAGKSFDLRCHVREMLLLYIQTQYPDYLPRVRADLSIDQTLPRSGPSPERVQ